MDLTKHKLGHKLSEIVKSRKVTQETLAKHLGVGKSAFSKWLSGDNKISGDKLERICKRLKLDAIETNELMDLAIEEWPDDSYDFEHRKIQVKTVTEIIHTPYIPDPEADIYFPLKLAKEVKEKVDNPDEAPQGFFLDYPGWVEQEDKWRTHLEVKPADEILEELVSTAGLHVIVGEPGGGKSTLLRHLGKQLLEKKLIPLLVPLREVSEEGIVDFFEKQKKRFNLDFDTTPYLKNDLAEDTRVVWLFDGWDELPRDLQEQWAKLIRDQSKFPCFVSCRIAQYNNDFGKPYYLMGLYPEEQKQFLNDLSASWKEGEKTDPNFSNVTDAWVTELHSKLQENEQIRHLAGSPLLLTLISKTNSPAKGIELPLKRIDFYRKAFRSLIEQRQKLKLSNPRINKLRKFLGKLSFETNQNGIRAEFSLEKFYNLAEKCGIGEEDTTLIEESSLIKITSDERCQWLHLTFAEWLLAEAWKEQKLSLLDAIKQYWQHPDYDEALALYWSSACSEERTKAINYLVQASVVLSKKERKKSRSSLKILVRLYNRSGVKHNKNQFSELFSYFEPYKLRKYVLAKEKNLSQDLIDHLVKDKCEYVRKSVLLNSSLREDIVLKLSQDKSYIVRQALASLEYLPSDAIANLLKDVGISICRNLAKKNNLTDEQVNQLVQKGDFVTNHLLKKSYKLSNQLKTEMKKHAKKGYMLETGFPYPEDGGHLIEELNSDSNNWQHHKYMEMLDEDKLLLDSVKDMKTPSTEILNSENELIKIELAGFKNISSSIVDELITDPCEHVREAICRNHNLSIAQKNRMMKDPSIGVRYFLASKENLGKEIFEKLAEDVSEVVRWNLASNKSITPSSLYKLTQDKSETVRYQASLNPNVCWEWLTYGTRIEESNYDQST